MSKTDLNPTLGPIVVDWIEEYLCHGPGDVQGAPIKIDAEMRRLIYNAYELHPPGHPRAGKRVYKQAVLSRPKGRALSLNTPVPTPGGWTTMRDIMVGDLVFDESGNVTTVECVSAVMHGHDCYAVTFSDGEVIVADAEHRWSVEELRKRYREHVVDTEYLYTYQKTRSDGACNFRLKMPATLNLPNRELPIDPYILGYWLGDGSSYDSQITVHHEDLQCLAANTKSAGYYIGRFKSQKNSRAGSVRISSSPIQIGHSYTRDSLIVRLRNLGVLGRNNKHVPEQYLRAGNEQRLAILQGLLDSDGTIGPEGRCGFVSTLKTLTDSVEELLASFGIKCTKSERRATLYGKDCGPIWHLDFWAPHSIELFRLPRKASRQPVTNSTRGRLCETRRVVSVEKVESEPVRCITVDSPNHLFLVGRKMVQTHNSKSELAGAIVCAEALGPVKFDGWDASGDPVGVPVTNPVIKCFATEANQAGLTYDNVLFMLENGLVADEYDIDTGLTRTHISGGGEIISTTSAGTSKDGGRETLAVFDEALSLDTPLPTPTGWTTMGSVKVGDFLLGADGYPVEVVKTTQVQSNRVCYRVTFSDNTSIVASDGHQWLARRSGSGSDPKVRTTGELYHDRFTYRPENKGGKDRTPLPVDHIYGTTNRRYSVPAPSAWILPEAELPVDPYLLGLWLGDGSTGQPNIAVGGEDVAALENELSRRGIETHRLRKSLSGSSAYRLSFSKLTGFHKGTALGDAFRSFPCWKSKHVPEEYFLGSIEQRTELVRGLMDSDGHCSKTGSCSFTGNDQLSSDLLRLLRSLGQVAARRFAPDPRSRVGGGFVVYFSARGGFQPFSIPRKADRLIQHKSPDWVSIKSIEPVESVPVKCVAVDSTDHLFLAGESGMVTHNTHLWYTRKLKDLYSTVTRNITKRKIADGWALVTTTMFAPGEGSVAEDIYNARNSLEGLLYDHRQAPMDVDIDDDDQLRAALQYVYGPAAEWTNIEAIIQDEFRNPTKRESDNRRYWLNQPVTTENRFVSGADWDACYVEGKELDSSVPVVIGFDGSFSGDYTAIVGVSCEDVPHAELIAIWEKPDGPAGLTWRVDIMDVMEVIRKTCKRLNVREVTADPHLWSMPLQILAEEGIPVTEFPQSSARMAPATKRLYDMIMSRTLTHSADASSPLRRHMINAHTKEDARGFRLVKETDKSPNKIDAAVATVMALEVAEQSVDAAPQVYSIADLVYGHLAKPNEPGTDTMVEPAPIPQQTFHSF